MTKPRLISIQTKEENSTSYAISKARSDVNKIVDAHGYVPLVLGSTSRVGLFRVLKRHYDIFSLRFRLRSSDKVFFQYPWIHNNKPDFYHNLFGSGAEVNCIIHDLDYLRTAEQRFIPEFEQLKNCSHIIAHTPVMKDYLVDHGIEPQKISVLFMFDYLTDDPIHHFAPKDIPTVIFAGNLTKSPFVDRLCEISSPGLQFSLYGNGAEHFKESDYVKYNGTFSPHHPGKIKGNWGLVWDGSDTATCNGTYGAYLRYNASHKASLYLSLGIPLIIWAESGLKSFVKEHHLGIAVSSLSELEHKLSHLTPEEIEAYQHSARTIATSIRSGEMLNAQMSEL